jgi:hypothetical protein
MNRTEREKEIVEHMEGQMDGRSERWTARLIDKLGLSCAKLR